ncbi:MAG: TIGR04076 family protein [Clostridium sp.]|nr:TIGR04076 family protein [Clostridium sp.]
MNRRKFIGLTAIGLTAAALPAAVSGAVYRTGEARFRVTVLRRECFCDLQSRYLADPDTGPCNRFRVGDRFEFSIGDRRPERFCQSAWDAIVSRARTTGSAAAGCGDSAGSSIVCCGDGTRPVIFKLERL